MRRLRMTKDVDPFDIFGIVLLRTPYGTLFRFEMSLSTEGFATLIRFDPAYSVHPKASL